MDLEQAAIVLGAILPRYPTLFAIYEKIDGYDVMYEKKWSHRVFGSSLENRTGHEIICSSHEFPAPVFGKNSENKFINT